MSEFKYFDESKYDWDEPLLKQLADIKMNSPKKGMVHGAVRGFKNGELVMPFQENLVVGLGRQYVAQRLFALSIDGESTSTEVYDWVISHFGVGNGGSTTAGSYVNFLGPTSCDQDLYVPQALSDSDDDYLTSPGDEVRGTDSVAYSVKSILPHGQIDLVTANDLNCTFGSIYSYIRVRLNIVPGEPDYLDDEDFIIINEAGLYYTDGTSNNVRLFAHVCFAPKYIETKSEFVIEWYVLC